MKAFTPTNSIKNIRINRTVTSTISTGYVPFFNLVKLLDCWRISQCAYQECDGTSLCLGSKRLPRHVTPPGRHRRNPQNSRPLRLWSRRNSQRTLPPLQQPPTNIRSEDIIKTSNVSRLRWPISIKRSLHSSFHPAMSPTTQLYPLSEANFPIAFLYPTK
jgi:hypothetical protein